jgi:hypothetical protein
MGASISTLRFDGKIKVLGGREREAGSETLG